LRRYRFAKVIETFKEFSPQQRPSNFRVDQIVNEMLKKPGGG